MTRSRFAGVQDYLALGIRRKWWVILPFVAFSALVVLLSTMMPKIYRSETLLQIQPREVPTDFVKDLIGGTTDQRLNAIEQIILSRTNLLKILKQFENGMTGYQGLNAEEQVLKLQSQIVIEFPSERIAGRFLPVANVRISYRDRNPELAQRITERMAALFIEQESRSRENQVVGTTEFLNAELNKITALLQQSSDRLKILKEKYRYELPDQLETNLRTLDRLQAQKTGNLEALDRHLTTQLNLERQLSDTPAVISRDAVPLSSSMAGVRPQNPLVETLRRKEQEYNELRAKVTDKHPDLLRLEAELAQLKKEIPSDDPVTVESAGSEPAKSNYVPNPLYQSIEAQLRQINTEIEIRQREKKWIEAEMARYNQRVQNTPRAEQEIASIVRTNADLIKQHEDLKSNLTQAKLAESLEEQQKGAQFAIIDPANYPMQPLGPGRAQFILVGILLSLGASLALAFLLGMLDQRIWTQSELERFLGAPVLVEIPKILEPADTRSTLLRQMARIALTVAGFGIYAGCLYYLYLHQTTVARWINPLMEKIINRYA